MKWTEEEIKEGRHGIKRYKHLSEELRQYFKTIHEQSTKEAKMARALLFFVAFGLIVLAIVMTFKNYSYYYIYFTVLASIGLALLSIKTKIDTAGTESKTDDKNPDDN